MVGRSKGLVFAVALVLLPRSDGLSPLLARSKLPAVRLFQPSNNRIRKLVPLRYRAHDEEDDDTALLKVQTRAPPGFDVKDNLQVQRKRSPSSAMNVPLIRALMLNQALILSLASVATGALLFFSNGFRLFDDWFQIFVWSGETSTAPVPMQLLYGVLGSIPMLALSKTIESSDNRAFANVNFSTITMCMTLFGRRKMPPDEFLPEQWKGKTIPTTSTLDALCQSFALSTLTGICEETVFRCQVAALIHYFTGGSVLLAYLGQAVLFGLAHAQPHRGANPKEQGIVVGLQFANGLLEGAIYVVAGGSLIACMTAHAIYDFVVFFVTWADSNGQIEYAEEACAQPLPADAQHQVDEVLSGQGTVEPLQPQVFNAIKRLFYTFDHDKNKTLSKSEVRKGFAYLALERGVPGGPPPQEKIDALFDTFSTATDQSRLSLADFLRLYTQSLMNKRVEEASVRPRLKGRRKCR